MMKPKFCNKFILGILFLLSLNSYGQKALLEKDGIIYCAKVYGYNIGTNDFIIEWLSNFDEKFETYKNNEFELNAKRNEALQEINALSNELQFTDIYTQKMDAEFGQYDFNTKNFEFKPLQFADEKKQINTSSYFYVHTNIISADHNRAEVYALNFKDFDGIPMETNDANLFINNRTKQGYNSSYVNRKVYLKIYFSILPEKMQDNYGWGGLKDIGLYSYVYKIEVWGDECMSGNKIAVLNAKQQPPTYLLATGEEFNKNYDLGNTQEKLPLEQGWIKIVDQTLYNNNSSNCNKKNHFEIHLSMEKDYGDLYKIKFKFRTNACLIFSPGFFYTITDFKENKYPLLVTDVTDNIVNDYKIVSVRINKETLKSLGDGGLADIKFQFNPTSQYQGSSNYTKYFTNKKCTSSIYLYVNWSSLKKEAPEYWLDENANDDFKKMIKTILNQ